MQMEKIGRGTPPWRQTFDLQTIFFGIESLAGYAVASGHPALNQRLNETELLTPGYRDTWGEVSAVAVPIMYAGSIA